jgi:inorganic triphosphatase YgiF
MHGTTNGTGRSPHKENKEIELKLELAPADLTALKKIPLLRSVKPVPKGSTQVSVYFDTNKQTLRKKGLMLRVRRDGRRFTQTIKTTGNSGNFERNEWEAQIAGNEPDFDQADRTALGPVLTKKLRRGLKPVFETQVRRTVYPLVDNGHAIALTVDQGTIDAGKRSLPLCEIELELERGNAADLFEVAHKLTQALPARLVVRSKSERGYEILDGEQEMPVKATSIDLHVGGSAREAFKTIGFACLSQVINNEPALIRGDPEGVHQMRVGLRRLRAAMSLFAALLRDRETAAIKDELKWLAGELGPARELEVLVNRVVAPMKRHRRRWRGMPSLSQEFAERRDAAVARAQEAVQAARFRALTLDLAMWLEAGMWTNPQDDLVRSRGDLPIEFFASEQLARRWRKVRKKGRLLAQLDARGRHKLRIQTKKLRYAAEFFALLFTTKRAPKRRKQFLPALERLQDGLGDLNDIAVHEKRIAAMGVRRRPSNPSRVFAAGLLTGREEARKETTMNAAIDAYADLAKVKPFWR